MDFQLNPEQAMLQDAVTRLLQRHYGFAQRQAHAHEPPGWSTAMWQRYAEAGLLSLFDPDMGGGPVETMVVMEAFGAALVLEPFLATVVQCAQALQHAGTAAQRAGLLPRIAAGELVMALAHAEPGSGQLLAHVATRAVPDGTGWRLRGHKSAVLHGDQAGVCIVSARLRGGDHDPEGLALFLVDAGAPGLRRSTYRMQDGLGGAELVFEDLRVEADAMLGTPGEGLALLQRLQDHAIAAQAAECVGAMRALHALTVDYLKTRRQFGVPIGSFQVLQHRCVDMLVEIEQARSMAMYASMMVASDDAAARGTAMSAVKLQVARAARGVAQQALQLHGGIGMATEYAASHYVLRLTAAQMRFGDAGHHLRALAAHEPVLS